MVGNRASKEARPVASSHRLSTPWAAIRSAMARLTTSRGASSSTKRSPSASRRRAPWPRRASDSRGRGMAGWCRAVGWNCMNSTSATGTPARRAMARPSAVASAGLVVTANSWPGPAGGQHGVGGPDLDRPTLGAEGHAPRSTARPRPAGRGRTTPRARRRRVARVASTRARSTSAPVAAPPAWTTRAVEWPPSRARARAPPGCRSKTAPMAISSLTRAGPSSTRTRTASVSHRPAPAARVSARCRSVESSSPPNTAATPPWAQRVADWDSSALVSTPTRSPVGRDPRAPAGTGAAARRTAAESPATPLPRTRTSKATGATSAGLDPPQPPRNGPVTGQRSGEDRGCRSAGPGPPWRPPAAGAAARGRRRCGPARGRRRVDHGGVVEVHRGSSATTRRITRLHRGRGPVARRPTPRRRPGGPGTAPGRRGAGPGGAVRCGWTGPGRRGRGRSGTPRPGWAGPGPGPPGCTRASCWKSFSPK